MRFDVLLGTVLALGAGVALADAPITPTYTTSFGYFDPATFGGSGISKDATAVSDLGDGVVLGMSATQRYENPVLTNNGAATFYAMAGGDILDSAPTFAKWNFDYYVSSGSVAGKTFKLFYDFDPALANLQGTHGVVNFGNLGGTGNTYQDSQNLGMGWLATSSLFVTAPTGVTSFDPDALGTYTFALVAYSGATELGRSAIAVTVVPEPEAYGLALAGLALVGLAGRRRKATAARD